jgi:hypothetical protein
MTHPSRTRKCKHCKVIVVPDPRCVTRQRSCSNPKCRKASKTASQPRWLHKPVNRDYFTGPTHVERVRAWRQVHPAYWRRQGSKKPVALHDELTTQPNQNQSVRDDLNQDAFQDELFRQPTVLVGLIAHLSGFALPDDIVNTTRRLHQVGHDILNDSPHLQGGLSDAQTPHLAGQTPATTTPVQLGRSAMRP